MSQESDTNILLSLLVILSIITFLRTFIYILFHNDLAGLDKRLGFNLDIIMEGILTIFAVLRLLIVTLIFIKRQFKNDILTYVLLYLLFTSFLRFYYEYLYFNKPKSIKKYYVDKFQTVNAVGLFLASGYILKFIFLK